MFTVTEQPSARSIVYVDEDSDRGDLFVRSFGRDFEVVAVADATSAVALLDRREIGVLVGGEEVLRIARERSPRTVRLVVGGQGDADRILRVLDEGVAARHIVAPWQEARTSEVLRWACEQWQRGAEVRRWLHDLRTPLTTILANAEHLEALPHSELRAAIESGEIQDQHRIELLRILDDLLPIAEDLASATNDIEQALDRLQETPDVIATRLRSR